MHLIHLILSCTIVVALPAFPLLGDINFMGKKVFKYTGGVNVGAKDANELFSKTITNGKGVQKMNGLVYGNEANLKKDLECVGQCLYDASAALGQIVTAPLAVGGLFVKGLTSKFAPETTRSFRETLKNDAGGVGEFTGAVLGAGTGALGNTAIAVGSTVLPVIGVAQNGVKFVGAATGATVGATILVSDAVYLLAKKLYRSVVPKPPAQQAAAAENIAEEVAISPEAVTPEAVTPVVTEEVITPAEKE